MMAVKALCPAFAISPPGKAAAPKSSSTTRLGCSFRSPEYARSTIADASPATQAG